MTFLNSFEVVRYRGIDGLFLPRLAPANLMTGVNGIGKTAVLEAMWLFTGRYNAQLLWNANVQRSNKNILDPVAKLATGALELRGKENGSLHCLKTTFEQIADIRVVGEMPIEPSSKTGFMGPPVVGRIRTELDGSPVEQKVPGIHVTPLGAVVHDTPEPSVARPHCIILGTGFHLETPNEYLQRHSDMVRQDRKNDIKKEINLILPKVQNVEILTNEMGEPYLSAITADGIQLPLHGLGGGVIRLYHLFLSFFTSRDGILFADELENGLHHSVLGEIWTHARGWMRQWNVQLVVTTHSDECIRAAMAAFEDAPEDLAIHKLFRDEKTGKVQATTFTGESLEGARDLNLETR